MSLDFVSSEGDNTCMCSCFGDLEACETLTTNSFQSDILSLKKKNIKIKKIIKLII